MRNFLLRILPICFVGLSFAVVGYFTGWLVGASQTPVVATALPLILGLLGGMTYASFERKAALQKVLARIRDLEKESKITIGTGMRLEGELAGSGEADPSYWPPALWALGTVLFCLACYFGVQQGVAQRVPAYPSLAELVLGAQPTPEELSALFGLRLHLQRNHVPPDEVKSLFQRVIIPILSREQSEKRNDVLINTRTIALLNVVYSIKGTPTSEADALQLLPVPLMRKLEEERMLSNELRNLRQILEEMSKKKEEPKKDTDLQGLD